MDKQVPGLVPRRSYQFDGRRLRETRLQQGLTQIELAHLSGYSERVIRKAEAEGRAAGATITDLVDTLVEQGADLTVAELLLDPLATCQQFMALFQQHHRQVLRYCADDFAEDFVFICAGPSDSPIAGEFPGIDGFQRWLDQFFGIFDRAPGHQLEPEFFQTDGTILVRYTEQVTAAGLISPPIWVNLHFEFADGEIIRLRDEYDTHAGIAFLASVAARQADAKRLD